MNDCIGAVIQRTPAEEFAHWKINPILGMALGAGLIIFYIILFSMLRRRSLVLRYTLLWMASGLVLLVFLLFPRVVLSLAELVGISNPVNAVFLLFAGFSLLLILSLTAVVSKLSTQSRAQVQAFALLEKRVQDLEKAVEEAKKT